MFLANLVLRDLNPGLINMIAPFRPTFRKRKASWNSARWFQNIANGIDISNSEKGLELHPDVLLQLGDFRDMRNNMLIAFSSVPRISEIH